MKKFLFIVAAALVTAGVQAQPKADDLAKFDNEVYDFGKIKQGVPVHTEFYFTNISRTPITVSTATASCGCTTPTKPEQPIMPGKKDKIQAGYNAASAGTFEKTIFITFDGASGPKELKIKGEVVSPEAYVEPATNLVKTTPAVTPVQAKTMATTKKTTKTKKTHSRS